MAKRRCAACGGLLEPRRNVPQQRYCSERACQRTRRRRWQRRKLKTDADYQAKLKDFIVTYKESIDKLKEENPYGVPITTRGWAGNNSVISWATTNYYAYKAFPDIIEPEDVYRGLDYILGCHPYHNLSFVSAVGAKSKKVAYGSNRADFAFIAGGIVPGILVLNPDFPENKEDWPFFWGENEYIVDIGADFILLSLAINELISKE